MNWEEKKTLPEFEKKCGSWQLSFKNGNFFLSNLDIIAAPCGYGPSVKAAMQSFLNHVAEYRKNLDDCEKYINEEIKNED